ncbi:head GIN domain-containing protein [Sphingomonas sp. LHG3406-1]|uniref:head GIN domain-containing protein n=1 Tax=Sphingomonas sp. LHG3406-1 TaxID=2804617 RepID=UPI00262A4E83|nr:head GIN domain-containing protein [Sphingomonas sp. LHG3406-1]
MRHHLLAAASLVVASLAGCSESQAETGPSVSRNFPVPDFDKLAVAGPFDVTVATGKAASVAASGEQKLIDAMEVVVENGTLKIRPMSKGMMRGFSWNGQSARVTITVPSLQKAELAGSGDLAIDRITGDSFEAGVAGSGDLRLGDVAVKQLKIGLAGSGDASARGRADNLEIGVAGSGDVDASSLTAVRAKLGVAGSGDLRARVTGEAEASVAGSGNIDVSGGARCTTSKRGSGEVRCS